MVDITTVFMGVIYGLKTDLYLGGPHPVWGREKNHQPIDLFS